LVEVLPDATDGAGVGELFDLKKSPKVFFGDGDGVTVGEAAVVAFVLCFFSAGEAEGEAAAADAAGETSVVAFVFLARLAGDGDASAAAEALASGEAAVVASAFL
jgi:hypothetical protein